MSCLSQKQLARLALGLTEDAELTAHLDQCPSCRASLEAMQSLRHELTEGHAKFNVGHDAARERLLAILPAASQPPEPARPWKRTTNWMGALTMRQRITALGGVGVAALLAFLLLWGAVGAKPLSAMEKMAEQIRKAKSYKCALIQHEPNNPMLGKSRSELEQTGTQYWLAPGSMRVDLKHAQTWRQPGPEGTIIQPAGKPSLHIWHGSKMFEYLPVRQYSLPLDDLQDLARFSGEADRELGAKEINGKKARGFEVDIKKFYREFDPETPMSGLVEIWIDAVSNLPLLVRAEMKYGDVPADYQLYDFQWNIDLDPKLFDPVPPQGYKNITALQRTLNQQVGPITESLRIYAEASGGNYPRGNKLYFTLITAELSKMLGVANKWPSKEEQEKGGNPAKFVRARNGFLRITGLESSSDFAYYGKTVGPKDKDKVLLRWKLNDGRYKVIFGDLRDETVSAERLHALERK